MTVEELLEHFACHTKIIFVKCGDKDFEINDRDDDEHELFIHTYGDYEVTDWRHDSYEDDMEMRIEREENESCEEAIYQITNYGLDDPDSPMELAKAAEKWREACEKQIPKHPKLGLELNVMCPSCGHGVGMIEYKLQKYCDECGQKLFWRDADANE